MEDKYFSEMNAENLSRIEDAESFEELYGVLLSAGSVSDSNGRVYGGGELMTLIEKVRGGEEGTNKLPLQIKNKVEDLLSRTEDGLEERKVA